MIQAMPTSIVMREVTDPEELAKAKIQDERFERNLAWFDAHAADLFRLHRGKCLCISGEQLFVADSPREAIALAKAAHPQDDGRFTHYVPKERMYRIYANRRSMVSL
jgi:hypothetical protein